MAEPVAAPVAGPPPGPQRPPVPPPPVGGPPRAGRLEVERLVVVGGATASGAGATALHFDHQVWSFPAQVARCLGVYYRQPLLEPPGVGNLPGLPALPMSLPDPMQTSLFARDGEDFPPRRPYLDLSLPGLRLVDVLERRPCEPIVDRRDAVQALLNLVVGLPAASATGSGGRLPTIAEAAASACSARTPALVMVALGDRESLDPIHDPAAPLPDAAAFAAGMEQLLSMLGGGPRVVATVTDPADTAAAVDLASAARTLKLPVADLAAAYDLAAGDRLTVRGLMAIGCHLFAGEIGAPLPPGAVVPAGRAAALSRSIEEINQALRCMEGILVLDLHAVARSWRRDGVPVPGRTLGADYLGGLYTLNGYTLGAVAHARVAIALLELLEDAYGSRFPRPDVVAVAAADPVADHRPAAGPDLPTVGLRSWSGDAGPSPATAGGAPPEPVAGSLPQLRPRPVARRRLELPPGREQVLPLSRRGSWFGDGILPVNAHADDSRGLRWGATGNLLFGGLALVDSPLSGQLRIRFDAPVGNQVRFEIDFGDGFVGGDATLTAPWLFRMPFRNNRVDAVPGTVSSGVLDLATGEVTQLQIYAQYRSDALGSLVAVNPTFPRQPLSFPGAYGSAAARFEPRLDGLLDFTFHGTTFVPLGPGIRWPLPFRSASGGLATVPAAGTAMHPHLHLSTREPQIAAGRGGGPPLVGNSVHELVLFTHNSAFGDAFSLHAAELGGDAVGRSHLLGRLRVQVGEAVDGAVPVALRLLPPGGYLAGGEPIPLDAVFPGRLSTGVLGHDEVLRFPLRSYALDAVTLIEDPFDFAVGRVDVASGVFLEDVLHRAFIGQNLFYALVRVEPRTPGSSFFFRGPARLAAAPGGGLAFRFEGDVHIPYPEGFLFPAPDLASGFVIGPDSALDPYVWVRAAESGAQRGELAASGERLTASTGAVFSYRLRVAAGDGGSSGAVFAYDNHSQGGSFRLHRLLWLDLMDASASGCPDTASFAALGTWSKDGEEFPHRLATVQVSTASAAPYVSIQIDGGRVSNVNLKPADATLARP